MISTDLPSFLSIFRLPKLLHNLIFHYSETFNSVALSWHGFGLLTLITYNEMDIEYSFHCRFTL